MGPYLGEVEVSIEDRSGRLGPVEWGWGGENLDRINWKIIRGVMGRELTMGSGRIGGPRWDPKLEVFSSVSAVGDCSGNEEH